jgi:hypothetical protein
MKRFKDLEACIARLKALQTQGDIEPEQRREIEAAITEARRLRRKRYADSCDVYACVRKITESLLNAFLK